MFPIPKPLWHLKQKHNMIHFKRIQSACDALASRGLSVCQFGFKNACCRQECTIPDVRMINELASLGPPFVEYLVKTKRGNTMELQAIIRKVYGLHIDEGPLIVYLEMIGWTISQPYTEPHVVPLLSANYRYDADTITHITNEQGRSPWAPTRLTLDTRNYSGSV